jgi:hypothetical protein
VKAASILLFASSTTTSKLGTLEVYSEILLFFAERERYRSRVFFAEIFFRWLISWMMNYLCWVFRMLV